MMNNDIISSKKAYIFDVDGTLYSQKLMRVKMAALLLKALFGKPETFAELRVILKFRRLREMDTYKNAAKTELYSLLGESFGYSFEFVRDTIDKWMFRISLEVIASCGYKEVTGFIKEAKTAGKRIIIYSDYPAVDKLKEFEIEADMVFSPGEGEVDELKPSPTIMGRIMEMLKQLGISSDEVLYIGDRDDRDRASAELVGIDYMDIKVFRKMINE